MADTFQDLLAELFAPLRGVSLRRMFGGIGIFREGIMFGLVADEVLYFRADETTSKAFADEGQGPWSYEARSGKAMVMPYWRVPERLFDEPDEFAIWARQAFNSAYTAKVLKPGKAKKEKSVKPAKQAPAKAAAKKATKAPTTSRKPARKARKAAKR